MTFAIPTPPCLHFPRKFEWSGPLWILPNPSKPSFQWSSLLGSHFRLMLPFVLLKIKWSLLKSSPPPGDKYWPAPKAPYFNAFLVGYFSRCLLLFAEKRKRLIAGYHFSRHVSWRRVPNEVLQPGNPDPKFRAIPSPTDTFNPKFRPNFAWKTRIPSFNFN